MGRSHMNGPVFGKITNNVDPENLGRVKVHLEHMGSDIETGWIDVITPTAGAFALPEVEEQVIVSFIGNNPDYCIVTGSSWNNIQKPPITGENAESDLNKDGENNLRFIKSRSGHMIIMDGTKGNEKIQFISGDGKTRFELIAKGTLLNIKTDGDMKISAKGKILIEGEERFIKMKKDFSGKGENIKVEGKSKEVSIKSGKNHIVKGTGINLN